MMRTKLLAMVLASAALGLATPAQATNDIVVDINGGGAGGVNTITSFDWDPGNALASAAITSGGIAAGTTFNLVAQASLSSFFVAGPPPNVPVQAGTEFTFQLTMPEVVTSVIGATVTFGLAPGPSTLSFYFDTTPDANDITGTGYGDGTLILTASIVSNAAAFTNNTALLGSPIVPLDGLAPDNAPGITTIQGTGGSVIVADVSFANPAFFLSNISSLIMDLFDNTSLITPFLQVNPSDAVFGVIPVYGAGGVNGAACAVGVACDFHFQADANTAFVSVPEPGALALLGLALGAAGFFGRRRRAQ
jgi:hypothetical protein